MAKNSVRDFSATANSNTDIQSVDIDENCAASGLNNAIRELMADLKDVSTGAVALESPQADSLTLTGNLNMSDNDKIVMGTGNDLEIYHDGSDSYINDAGTGDLKLGGNQLQLNNAAQTKNYLYAVDGAQVELKYNNAKKLETTSSGIKVANRVEVDQVVAPTLVLDSTATTDTGMVAYTSFQRGGSEKAWLGFGTAGNDHFRIQTNLNAPMVFATNTAERMRITNGGDLQFNSGYGSVQTAFGNRMWVNFNGTGTLSIRDSGNVSSITDSGVGKYDVYINNDMPDVNYAAVMFTNAYGSTGAGQFSNHYLGGLQSRGAGWIRLEPHSSSSPVDATNNDIAIFR